MENTCSEILGSFAKKIRYEDLPAEVIKAVKNCFLDWLGCVYAAGNELPVQAMAEIARLSGGKEHSTVIPYGERNSAPFSALVNAAAAHALEMDDVHRDSVVHAATVVIPAVFAVAERESDYDLGRLTRGLDQEPPQCRILSNTFKPYPSCRHTHPAIDAALALALEHDLDWKGVEKVDVYTYSGAVNLCGPWN
jgi:2-methylcitrate dehydratase PrpD